MMSFVNVNASEQEREIKVLAVGYTGDPEPSELFTAKAIISGTTLTITFIDKEKWLRFPFSGKGFYPRPMMVRYFDKAGDYLGHFRTSSAFIPKWALDYSEIEEGSYLTIPAGQGFADPGSYEVRSFKSGESVSYNINARDANFIEIIELSVREDSTIYRSLKQSKEDFEKKNARRSEKNP